MIIIITLIFLFSTGQRAGDESVLSNDEQEWRLHLAPDLCHCRGQLEEC
jgi:hypothetical protein